MRVASMTSSVATTTSFGNSEFDMVCVKPFPIPVASIQAPVLHASTIQALPRLALMQAEDKSPLGRLDKTFVYLKLNSPRTLGNFSTEQHGLEYSVAAMEPATKFYGSPDSSVCMKSKRRLNHGELETRRRVKVGAYGKVVTRLAA